MSPYVVRDASSSEIGIIFELSDEEFQILKENEAGIEEWKNMGVEDLETGEVTEGLISLPKQEEVTNEENYEMIEYKGWLGMTKEEMESRNTDYLEYLLKNFALVCPKANKLKGIISPTGEEDYSTTPFSSHSPPQNLVIK